MVATERRRRRRRRRRALAYGGSLFYTRMNSPKHAPRRIARVTAERTTRRTHPRSRASPPPPPMWRWRRDWMRPRSLTPSPSPSPRNARRDLPRRLPSSPTPSRGRAGEEHGARHRFRIGASLRPRLGARARPSRRHPPPRVPPRRVAPPPSPPTRPRPRPRRRHHPRRTDFEFIEALLRRARRLARPLDHDVRANFDVAAGVGDESQPRVRPAPLRVARHARVRHVPNLRRAPDVVRLHPVEQRPPARQVFTTTSFRPDAHAPSANRPYPSHLYLSHASYEDTWKYTHGQSPGFGSSRATRLSSNGSAQCATSRLAEKAPSPSPSPVGGYATVLDTCVTPDVAASSPSTDHTAGS